MHTTVTTAISPKHLFRLAERTYGRIHGDTEAALLSEAVRATRELLRGRGEAATGVLLPLDEVAGPGLRLRLRQERVVVVSEPEPSVSWLLRGRVEWSARFVFPAPPSEDVTDFLEIAREAVQLRLSEHAWTGVVDRVQAIQRSLLPDPVPRIPGFEVAARSVPAESVGGDVFDVLVTGDGRLLFVVADASGHGLPAALEARDVVVGIRMGLLCGARLAGLVGRLNDVLLGTTLSSRFVSLVLGEIDPGGVLRYVNAGHPAPLLVGDGPPRPLEGTGRVLGITRSYPYRLFEARIRPGCTLVVTTDGVSECLSPSDEELGNERLARLAADRASLPAVAMVDSLFDALGGHAGARGFHDDVTVLVVRRHGEK